jgi:hypothetical protein
MNLEHQGIITEKRGEGNVWLVMMLSSSQVLDHQLIFHIMYGLRQFHHRKNKGGEEREDLAKKSNSCLTNIERKRWRST